jgi:hypothetical protein
MLKTVLAAIGLVVGLTSCVVVPVAAQKKEGICAISNDRQTLRVMDFAKDT